MDLNRSNCKSTTDVICFLTANTFASKVKDAASSLASMFRAPAFAPIAA